MKKDLTLIKEAVDRLLIKQEKFLIRPNDIFFTDHDCMVQEGKEWIWELLQDEMIMITTERRNEKLNTILGN